MSHAASDLSRQLSALPIALRAQLASAGFEEARFLEQALTLRQGDPETRRQARNTVRGEVRVPYASELSQLPPDPSPAYERLVARGRRALKEGELAVCAMAGGMATRMGGVVKALVEVMEGRTFLELRLAEVRRASERAGRGIPLWLMTSEATHEPLTKALAKANAPSSVACFMQNLSLRLTPEGALFKDAMGEPSVYATGHGDLVDALRRSPLLDAFRASGGKYVWITNIDNVGASIDEAVLGHFIARTDEGFAVQCEVCSKVGDRGGIPVFAEGKLQVLEEFRLPPGFDPASVDVFNTNTFLVKADALAESELRWTYFEVEKRVEGLAAVQFERLLQELTAELPTSYLRVEREGVRSRFLPVKDFAELERRRADIEAVARARAML
jgi:UTP--glucose-1-phosphate uridylyltransferase